MEIAQRTWKAGRGWSEALPAMDSAQTLVMAFAAPEMTEDRRALTELAAAYPGSVVVGCSSSGEISQDQVSDATVSVGFARFASTAVRSVVETVDEAGSSEAVGKALGEQLSGEGLRAVLVLSDGLNVNGTALSAGLQAAVGNHVVVTGGLAGDGARFGATWVYAHGELGDHRVVAVGLYGDKLQVGHGSRGGWDVFGPPRTVTKSEGNVLFSLDGRPALELYKEYLGERASGLPATALLFPLALRDPAAPERELVRTILAVDEDTQSMTFAGDVPQGAQVQLMRANMERLVDGAASAADLSLGGLGSSGPVFAVAISCVGRRLVLGEATEEEVEATLETFPDGSVQVGFYSYGELSPTAGGTCELHNQTMTLTALREA